MMAAQKKPLLTVCLDEDFAAMSPRERGRLLARCLAALLLEAADRDDPVMSRAQAAEYAHRTPECLRLWFEQGLGRYDPTARCWRVTQSELDAWMRAKRDRLKKTK